MSFKVEGTIDVTVKEAYVQECRFPAKENEVNERGEMVQCYYEVALLVQDEAGNNDVWHGEISSRTGKGNAAALYRWEMTLKTLQDIGFNVQTVTQLEEQFQPTEQRSIYIPNLIGMKCKVVTENKEFTKRDGSKATAIQIKYLNGINGGAGEKRLNFDEFMSRRSAAPAPAPAPAAPQPQFQQPQGGFYGYQAAPAPAAPAPAPASPASRRCPY